MVLNHLDFPILLRADIITITVFLWALMKGP